MLRLPDLSHYEPDVDFHGMKAAGIPGFITKASQGSTSTDPTYADFLKRGRSVDLIVGAYTYIVPGDPVPQVKHFLDVANLEPGDFQPVIDAEATGLTKGQTLGAATAFRDAGFRPILYMNLDFFRNVMGGFCPLPLWLAAYRSIMPDLPLHQQLFLWQNTDHGVCPGVKSLCDMNEFRGSLDDLKTYTI